MNIQFTTALLPKAFEILLMGMGGVFIVLFIIYLTCVVLQKLFPET